VLELLSGNVRLGAPDRRDLARPTRRFPPVLAQHVSRQKDPFRLLVKRRLGTQWAREPGKHGCSSRGAKRPRGWKGIGERSGKVAGGGFPPGFQGFRPLDQAGHLAGVWAPIGDRSGEAVSSLRRPAPVGEEDRMAGVPIQARDVGGVSCGPIDAGDRCPELEGWRHDPSWASDAARGRGQRRRRRSAANPGCRGHD
jgi:hypothetical protein